MRPWLDRWLNGGSAAPEGCFVFDLGMLLVWLGLGSAHAETAIAVDLVPLGRGDLAWMDSGQSSGTLVGENDGFLQSPIRPWA